MKLTIVMYHYVRDLARSRFPAIRGLDTALFREQVAYLKRHHTVISGEDLLDAAAAGALAELPPRAALLTFDDGYSDHFTQVFPVLDRERVTGCFFPPGRVVLEDRVLDVNKIHFVLASVPDPSRLADDLCALIDRHGPGTGALPSGEYRRRLAVPSRYDPGEVVFVKRALQRELPEALRGRIVDELFRRHVTADEAAFARELYLDGEQIRCMHRHGMTFGSHGYDHFWLNAIPGEAQAREVDRSLAFLGGLGIRTDRWMMCYPYGAHDEGLLRLLRDRRCAVGLTTRVGLADPAVDGILTLPRLDTNDLPKEAGAAPGSWTRDALAG